MIWRFACAGILLIATQHTFRSGAESVLVDVQVLVAGKPLAGLTAQDFEVRDSGVPQNIQVIAIQDVPLSLLLALDVSGSVRGDKLDRLKTAARAAIGVLGPRDQAAVVAFSQRVSLLSGWSADHAALDAAIDTARADGGTSLHDAVFAAMGIRERAAGRTVLLIFTDGFDTSSWLDPASVVNAARRTDVVAYAVSTAAMFRSRPADEGVNPAFRNAFDSDPTLFPYAFLDKLTEESGGESMYVEPAADLTLVFRTIVSDFKTRYLLSYTPAGVPGSGWHPITVAVRTKGATVKARRGYMR